MEEKYIITFYDKDGKQQDLQLHLEDFDANTLIGLADWDYDHLVLENTKTRAKIVISRASIKAVYKPQRGKNG